MKKLKQKLVCFGVVASCVWCIPQLSVCAYKKELKTDLSACKLQCSDNFINYLSLMMPLNGAKSWVNSDLKFTLNWGYRASGNITAYCYLTNAPNQEYIATTIHYSNTVGGKIDPDVNDWNYAFIYANTKYSANTFSQATFAHEIGHVMGLNHLNGNPKSIMCQEKYGRTATVPSALDRAALSEKYKNRS